METISRKDLLQWANDKVNEDYERIEQMCAGDFYCLMMEQLFPNCIGIKKIKTAPKLRHEYMHNLRLLQKAFTKVKCEKNVPIECLLKGRFQDNWEFLKWFKTFFETSLMSNSRENNMQTTNSSSNVKTIGRKNSNTNLNAEISKIADLKEKKETLTEQLKLLTNERDFYYEKISAITDLVKASIAQGEKLTFCNQMLDTLQGPETVTEAIDAAPFFKK